MNLYLFALSRTFIGYPNKNYGIISLTECLRRFLLIYLAVDKLITDNTQNIFYLIAS